MQVTPMDAAESSSVETNSEGEEDDMSIDGAGGESEKLIKNSPINIKAHAKSAALRAKCMQQANYIRILQQAIEEVLIQND